MYSVMFSNLPCFFRMSYGQENNDSFLKPLDSVVVLRFVVVFQYLAEKFSVLCRFANFGESIFVAFCHQHRLNDSFLFCCIAKIICYVSSSVV